MAAENQPWTTSRCNRLLRPISSRLATLRRELELQQRRLSETRKASISSAREAPHNAFQPPRRRKPRAFDPEWVPSGKPAGNTKRTYGRGAGKKKAPTQKWPVIANSSTRPGEITSTPLVSRSEARFMDSPSLHSSPLFKRKKKGPLVARVQQIIDIKKQMPPNIGKLIEGLLDGYTKLLQATHSCESKSRKGARSLMSTCLHQMPGYIELEEHFAQLDKEEADDDVDRDISDEIYTHLESTFSMASGRGWRHFRELVRAHATSLMCEAFSEGMLGLEVLDAAVDLCIRASAWEEAEKLLWAYFDNVKPLPTPLNLQADLFDQTTSTYMHLVRGIVGHTGRHGFLYDMLAHLIANDLLPLEWLATYCMRPVWNRLVRILCDGDNRIYEHALQFLQATIWAGIGLPDYTAFEDDNDIVVRQLKPSVRKELRGALDTTFSSLFNLLAGRALASPEHAERFTLLLDSITISLLRRNDIREDLDLLDTTTENMQTFAERAIWIVTAASLVHLEGCSLFPGAVTLDALQLMQTFRWITYQYSCYDVDVSDLLLGLPGFISSIARYSGKSQQSDGFEQLQSLVTKLLSLKGVRLPHKLWSLNRLALESSMEFAQSTNEGAHFVYARQVEKSMSLGGRVLLIRSPEKGETPSAPRGFRLEEGIGEWVACTPFAKPTLGPVRSGSGSALGQLPSPDPSEHADDLGGSAPSVVETPASMETCALSSSLGKHVRASSPKVVIPYKRVRLTLPDSASSSFHSSMFSFSGIAASTQDTGPRRSRRVKKPDSCAGKHGNSISPNPSRRSSLRRLPQKNYVEHDHHHIEVVDDEESSSEESAVEQKATAFMIKTNLPRHRYENEVPGKKRGRGRPRKRGLACFEEKENVYQDNEDDELGKTPSRTSKRLQAPVPNNGKLHTRRREQRSKRFKSAFVRDSDEESEDELSFA